jgi:hypothetical protein
MLASALELGAAGVQAFLFGVEAREFGDSLGGEQGLGEVVAGRVELVGASCQVRVTQRGRAPPDAGGGHAGAAARPDPWGALISISLQIDRFGTQG